MESKMNSLDFARLCLEKAEDKKAENGIILELKGHTVISDYFVIVTGNTDRHVKAIADELHHGLKKYNLFPNHMDGFDFGEWIVLDYSDVIVHVFKKDLREFYDIERLWKGCNKVQ